MRGSVIRPAFYALSYPIVLGLRPARDLQVVPGT